MAIQLRPANPKTDFPRIAELLSSYEPELVTVEHLREWEQQLPEGRIRRRWVAIDASGQIAGYGYVDRQDWMKPGQFELWVMADPSVRDRGVGAALKLLVIRCARTYGAAYIRTNNDSQNAPMLAINRKLGYRPAPGKYRLLNDLA